MRKAASSGAKRELGRQLGRQEALEGLSREAVRFAREQLGPLTDDQERAIRELPDIGALTRLIAGIATARDSAELDALLSRLSAPTAG